jgi:hypothetical protein
MGLFSFFKREQDFGVSRSGKWPKVRKSFLEQNPYCAVCGSKKKLNVHHIVPFHIDQSRELDPSNLITLCEGDVVNCHLLFGHFMNFRNFNPNVVEDAAIWNGKLGKTGEEWNG